MKLAGNAGSPFDGQDCPCKFVDWADCIGVYFYPSEFLPLLLQWNLNLLTASLGVAKVRLHSRAVILAGQRL